MEERGISGEQPKFGSPEEELAYLRAKVVEQEKVLKSGPENREDIIREQLNAHKQLDVAQATESYAVTNPEKEAIVLDLTPKSTDKKIEELLGLLEAKGLLNTLSIVESMDDPLIEDDFHRVLVQFVKKNLPVRGVSDKSTLHQALSMTLFEIALPEAVKDEKRGVRELLSAMEQLYAGIIPSHDPKNSSHSDMWISFEISVSNEGRSVVIYSAVPNSRCDLFEKQVLSLFPKAKITEQKDDYNIFVERGFIASSHAVLAESPVYPLKKYQEFEYDPLTVIINAFSKLAESGEGASVQYLIAPAQHDYVARYRKAIDEINKGVELKEVLNMPDDLAGEVIKDLGSTFKELFVGNKKKEGELKIGEKEQRAIEAIKQKIESPIVRTGIRIVVSAGNGGRAQTLLGEIESSFKQFESTAGNKIYFKNYTTRELPLAMRNFSFRAISDSEMIPLSLKELTSIFHFPTEGAGAVSELRQAKADTAPAPADMKKEGIYLGKNVHRNQIVDVYFEPEDRLRHFYIIGQTGTGKSTFLKNMIMQDIANGEGVCMIDPHGSDLEHVLSGIPPSRYDDVIYFDPAYIARPMGLNMLEYDVRFPEQKTFIVNELVSIFNKLFDMKVSGGPLFEQYFRNGAMLVMDHPESGNTLLEIGRVLGDSNFRRLKLQHCKNPLVRQFWENAERTTGEQKLENFVPYVTSKFDVFMSNDIMRPVVAQEKSAFNFREIMDNKKILLVNLSKGRLGDINSSLIGLVIVGKILMSALSRVDSLGRVLPPFYLYIDEFQNITTDSISTILSEARKYKLSLTMANQFIAQIEENIRNAVFGNVGSMASFRVGTDDSEYLEKQFHPVFKAPDFTQLDNGSAYLRMLVGGRPAKPFSLMVEKPFVGNAEQVSALKELSYLKYGKPREEVEANIMAKYKKT